MRVPILGGVAWLALLAACDRTVDGNLPVGGDQPSQAETERFARRLHLDLTGGSPDDDFVADAVARLGEVDDAATRRAIAQALIDAPAFAAVYVDEVEGRAYGGDTVEARYGLLCGIVRTTDPACDACAPPADGDACGTCSCAPLAGYVAERAALRTAVDDLAAGATTSSIERRYVEASPFRALASPDGVAQALFDGFLGHAPQLEERRNAAAMVQGALIAGSPAGLLYHRHGADYADLLDIVFGSEVYREAAVGAVFERYLGRRPTAAELGHFAAGLDPDDPDVRDVILAVVSSREYFEQ